MEKCEKYLFSVCYMLDTVFVVWNASLSKTAKDPCLCGAYNELRVTEKGNTMEELYRILEVLIKHLGGK